MDGLRVDNLVKFYVILALAERPRHGYELIREVQEKMGKTASPGQMYPFLQALKKRGLVEVGRAERKKVYKLTTTGRIFAHGLCERLGGFIDAAVRPQLTACAHCGCSVYRGGHKERIQGKVLAFCCCSCAKAMVNK